MLSRFIPVLLVLASIIAAATAFTGDLTFYYTEDGIGSCGQPVHDSDFIAAMAAETYDTFPGATANPNNNPICGRRVKVTYQGKSIVVKIADRCPGCPTSTSLDLTPTGFSALASEDIGVLRNAEWEWTDLPVGPVGPVGASKRAIAEKRMIRLYRSVDSGRGDSVTKAREISTDHFEATREQTHRGMGDAKPTKPHQVAQGKRDLRQIVRHRRSMDNTNPTQPHVDSHPPVVQDKRESEAGSGVPRTRGVLDRLVSREPLMERRWKDVGY